jgi:hypothetical protein
MTANASSYFALLRNDSSSFEVGRQLGLEEIRFTLFNTPLDEWRFAYTRSTNPLEGTRSQSATSIATNFLFGSCPSASAQFESSATSAP